MAENTKIEWADHTFNPWIGCMKVGPGCDHCYAETWDARGLQRQPGRWGPEAARTRTGVANWNKPRAWNRAAIAEGRRARVFSASLADIFDNHASISETWRHDLASLIVATPHLDWLLLTKRIGNAAGMLRRMFPGGVPRNIWLGATIVDQKEADRDIEKLRQTKADLDLSVAFLSMEPLLGPVDLGPVLSCPGPSIDWIIVGGETGSGARPMNAGWVRQIRDQCEKRNVPFLFKQWGNWLPHGEIDAMGRVNSTAPTETPGIWHEFPDGGGFAMRLDKTLAGRFIDGHTHDGFPGALA